MNYFKSFLLHYWYYFIILILLIGLIITSFFLYQYYGERKLELPQNVLGINNISNNEMDVEESLCAIDIKGEVKKPGVYKVPCDMNVFEVIEVAGGKNKNAYTNNINLSKKISDQMVIYIYSLKEIKEQNKEKNEINSCKEKTIYIDTCIEKNASIIENNNSFDTSTEIVENNEVNNLENEKKLISLNTATKEELMTLSNIGESKALSIISYREENNGFKNIEEIKNVSGIGDSIFEKIKSYITV